MKETHKRLLRSMQIIEGPIGEQFHMLAGNKADIVMEIEPFASIAESKGCRIVYSCADFHGPLAFTGFYTRQGVIDADPAMVGAMGRAMAQAFEIIHGDHAKTLAVAQRYFPKLDPAILRRSIERLRHGRVWQKKPATSDEAWGAAIAMRERVGDVFADDPARFVDNRFCAVKARLP
jgi:NitT/TauT family transport system substrate-binding protein